METNNFFDFELLIKRTVLLSRDRKKIIAINCANRFLYLRVNLDLMLEQCLPLRNRKHSRPPAWKEMPK